MLFPAVSVLLLPLLTTAHILLKSPPALGYTGNPYVTAPDYDLRSPISGAEYPCKGYHLQSSRGAGKSVATWPAGSTQSFQLGGTATHGGGSCQVSLSYNNGATFKVLSSWIGGCPTDSGAPFGFKVPAAAPAGKALFAWTWFNKYGNREMYMNCAVVNITGGSGGGGGLGGLPNVFTANIGKGCSVSEGAPVEFPNPGKVVVRNGETSRAPSGNCG